MGPPLRSSAADAHYCIMVQILLDLPNTSMWREAPRQLASASQIVPDIVSSTDMPKRNGPHYRDYPLTATSPYKSWVIVRHFPGLSGRPGCVRSSAWIWLFSSIETTTACLGGSM